LNKNTVFDVLFYTNYIKLYKNNFFGGVEK